MATLIELPTYIDSRGKLTVIEKIIPFTIKRVYYIYDVDDSRRGGHRHKKTIQALICLNGSCKIISNNGLIKKTYELKSPSQCLIINPEDFHTMEDFSEHAILLVLASEHYEETDYIDTPYD